MMRVIAGQLRGRPIRALGGKSIRPSSGLVRGVVFNVLSGLVENRQVLDLYAGSGALGIEALSRGARSAVFVESDKQVLEILKKNLNDLGISAMARIVQQDCLDFIPESDERYDLILADPPYKENVSTKIVTLVCQNKLLTPEGILVVQHHPKDEIRTEGIELAWWKSKRHGKTRLDFFRAKEDIS